jgi:hypothetical protein
LALFLDEVGARVSDVFGPDRILWVEGRTEERAFPLLLSAYAPEYLTGLAVLAVHQTGDFDSRHARRLFEIYRRLATAGTLLPTAVGFTMDRERRTPEERRDLEHLSGGLLHFLPRRMFENYLVLPSIVSSTLAVEDPANAGLYSEGAVDAWLRTRGSDREFWPETDPIQWGAAPWFEGVDGARVLSAMFRELSERRVEYDKVRHGMDIVSRAITAQDEPLRALVTTWLIPSVFERDRRQDDG